VKLLLALVVCLGAVSCVHPLAPAQIGVDGCIKQRCTQEGDPTGRAACESDCRRHYAR
jgi:hypothetical protein